MKKLSLIHKILYAINIVFIAGLFFSFVLPYLPPKKFGIISLLSLIVPILMLATILFLLYWILTRQKKQLYLNAFVLILSFFFIPSLYKLSGSSETTENELSILSYNVRKFNKYNWIASKDIPVKISEFINIQEPDIVSFQEYQHVKNFKLNYPYSSNPRYKNKYRTGLSIFSKYPIIKEQLLTVDGQYSPSATYVDIVKGKDTIRIYNFRFKSLGIIPDKEYFGHPNSEKLLKRLRSAFKDQEIEIKALNDHIERCSYKVILTGDMNNTAYSWTYKNTKNNFKDTFLEAGKGFGRTYNLKGLPLRIDYIFVDKDIKVNRHKNYSVKFSDHFPIMATVSF